jgi:hypothetical protein
MKIFSRAVHAYIIYDMYSSGKQRVHFFGEVHYYEDTGYGMVT